MMNQSTFVICMWEIVKFNYLLTILLFIYPIIRFFMINKLIYLFFISILMFSVDLIGQVKTKDGLNINLYITGSKKPLIIDRINEEFYGISGSRLLERIVISGTKEVYVDTGLKIKVFKISEENKRDLILSKDLDIIVFNGKNKSYSLPIIPWIDDIGNYKVIIESGKSILLDLTYEVVLPDGEVE